MSYQMRSRPRWHAGAGAAFVTTVAVVAGSLAATTAPASADNTTTTTSPAATTTVPAAATAQAGGLTWIKEDSAHLIADRVASLDAAIKSVPGWSFLGADGTRSEEHTSELQSP